MTRKMQALCFDRFGGPEVLSLRFVEDPVIGAGEALIKTHAIGLNYADIYRREGHYHLEGDPPYIAGYEAAGEVIELGPGVTGFQVGDRVGFADVPKANATLVKAPIEKLIHLPADISFELAAASLLQGLTAQYLIQDSHSLRASETVLIHAAAGGVGTLLTQLATSRGARVLALVSSAQKAERALQNGAHATALYSYDWQDIALTFSGGKGVDVVYDSIGTTLLQSLASTRVGGKVVYFGKAGGEPPPIPTNLLMDGSKTITGGDLWNVLTSQKQRNERANELFAWLRSGALRVDTSTVFELHDGAKAHRHLQSRSSAGKILLRPPL